MSTTEEPEHPRAASRSVVAFPRASGVEAPVCALIKKMDRVGVLEAHVVEQLANSLIKQFDSAGLDGVVPKKTHAVHTVGEKIDALRSAGRCCLESLESHF